MTDDADEQYTIDELAAATGLPSRTIRFYQSKGALPAPQLRGRVAYYGRRHVERLKRIGELQDRGLRIKAIKELLTRIDAGELGLGEWLGLQDQMKSAWAEDAPQVLSQAEVERLLSELPSGALADLLRHKLLAREGDAYLVRSPGLLRIALRLGAAGVSIELAAKSGEIMRKHLAKMTRELVDQYFVKAGDGFGRARTAQDLETALSALRPMGLEAVQLIFGHEVQKVLREHVESGRTAAIVKRPRTRK